MNRADAVVVRTLRGVWPSLPAVTVASAAVCLAAAVPVIVAPGVNPVALVLGAVAVAPFAAALIAEVDTLSGDDMATLRSWWRSVRTLWRFAIAQALVPAAAVTLFLAAAEVLARTGSAWVWPSFALTGAASVIAVLGVAAALPLGVAHPELRGRELWLNSVALVARHPTRFVAVVSAIGFGVWTATVWSASLLLLVPAPAAIVAVTATWTSVLDAGNAMKGQR